MIEIPLDSNPEQIFSISIEEINYDIRVILNSRVGVWSMDLSSSGEEILSGVPLLGGVDVFKQHNIPISNAYVINLDNAKLDPSKTNLGISSKLFILTDEEIENG